MSSRMQSGPTVRRDKPQQQTNPLLVARKQLEQAEQLRQAGKLVQAQKICEEVLKRYPDYVGMLHTIGLVLADRGQNRQALSYLVQAAMLNPHDWKTLTVLAGVYLRLGAREMAVRTLEQAQDLQPEDANIQGTLGEIYRDDREYEAAANAYRAALSLDPTLYDAQSGLGHSCTHLGQLEEAAQAFTSLLEHRPDSVNLLYSLSQLPPALVEVDLIPRLDKVVPGRGQERKSFEATVEFTKASALHAAGRFDEAWPHLLEANRLVLDEHKEENTLDERVQGIILDGARQHPVVKDKPDVAGDAPVSLFILGPSRSGKTTAEYLMSSIQAVKRGYENRILENAVRQTFQTAGLPSREWIVEMPLQLDGTCRGFYVAELKKRAGDAKVFTNTHPGHIRSALRIASVMPNARFIFVKRDMDDVMLRIFMKKYSEGNAYAYALQSTRDYVSWYYDMIDVVSERLPNLSMVVQYEDMIEDPAPVLEAAAKLCGLDASDVVVPVLGDDRGCGVPYRDLMSAELAR